MNYIESLQALKIELKKQIEDEEVIEVQAGFNNYKALALNIASLYNCKIVINEGITEDLLRTNNRIIFLKTIKNMDYCWNLISEMPINYLQNKSPNYELIVQNSLIENKETAINMNLMRIKLNKHAVVLEDIIYRDSSQVKNLTKKDFRHSREKTHFIVKYIIENHITNYYSNNLEEIITIATILENVNMFYVNNSTILKITASTLGKTNE